MTSGNLARPFCEVGPSENSLLLCFTGLLWGGGTYYLHILLKTKVHSEESDLKNYTCLLQHKDLFHRRQNVSNSTLYPDVLKIKTNCCETKFYKNAICLLFTNFQIHHLATLLPGCPSHRVARYGFINKKWHFLKIL